MDIKTFFDYEYEREELFFSIYTSSYFLKSLYHVEEGSYPFNDSFCFNHVEFDLDENIFNSITDCLNTCNGADLEYMFTPDLPFILNYQGSDSY